jgi:RNA polymerase sigma-70 factor (ECF subfamily)
VQDTDWVGALYDAHAAGMYSYALALLGVSEEAEDAVQDVFVKVCASGRIPENPRHYLLRSVRNEAFSRLRKRRLRFWRHAAFSGEARLFEQPRGLRDDELEGIEAALRGLPIDQREAVLLKVYEGMTFEQIGRLTDVSPNTAASRYRYAVEKLRGSLAAKEQADDRR